MIYNTWSVTHKVYNRNILWHNVNTDEAHIHIMMKKREFLFACLAFFSCLKRLPIFAAHFAFCSLLAGCI